ncbi:MAG: 5' nucleotidase, NT5C type [Halococcoides sp.]
MRIAVDVDGVIADRIGSIVERIDDCYGVQLAATDITEYDFSIPDTDVDIHDVVDASTDDPEHLLGVSPIVGAVDGMQALHEHHEVLIATHRPERIHEYTKQWLQENDVPYNEFLTECGPRKCAVEADTLVDDRPANVRAFHRRKGRSILFEQPWNSSESYQTTITVVEDWAELTRVCIQGN